MGVIQYPIVKVTNPTDTGGNYMESQQRVYPASNYGWSSGGTPTIQGKQWSNDASLDCWGDPTVPSSEGGNWARIRLNTGANHDCNCFWGATDKSKATERQVRGIYFRHHTNEAKFRPRITGVALVYANGTSTKYVGLRDRWNATGNTKLYASGGTLPYEGGSVSNKFWGVMKRGTTDGNWFHDPNWKWAGVFFHWESTWKSGSAINCDVYIRDLHPILDAKQDNEPHYNYRRRVWGVTYK